jgi:RNA polymerase sigma factor (sigma-70 family)
MLSELAEPKQTVLRLRFGLGAPERTLAEVGEAMGISAERVRQLEKDAVGKLSSNGAHHPCADRDHRVQASP